MTVTKRFIAGAVCPRCAEMDRLVTFVDEEETFKECVSCGFLEKQIVQLEVNELDTRVNHVPDQGTDPEDTVQVITIVDPSTKS